MYLMRKAFQSIIPICITLLALPAFGQMIDNTVSYRTINSDRYFRIHYENDYFSKTDFYYTQGINLEFVHPLLGKAITSKILIRSRQKQMKFGISSEHLGYTPTSISHPEILVGDRPFAASIFLKNFAIMNDSMRQERWVSSFNLGVIGPWAGGEEMQAAIHRWINDRVPMGWEHQIHNDAVINYQVDYEKSFTPQWKYFSVHGKTGGRVGTFSDKVYGGAVIMAGLYDNPFTNFSSPSKNFRIYTYFEPQLSVVGYDATLQGGLFNRNSPYTISSADISRVVFQYNTGLVIKVRGMYMEYFQSFLTKEFATGGTHHWGGVRLSWSFHKKD